LAKRLDRLRLPHQALGKIGQLLHLTPVNRLEEGLARRKVPVKRANTDTGRSRDGFEARRGAASAEHGFCGREDPFAVADCVGTRLSRGLFI
jgi:hypothetical protein